MLRYPGVNTHFGSNDSRYAYYNDPRRAIACVLELGLPVVRDAVPVLWADWMVDAYKALAAAGKKFSIVMDGSPDIVGELARIKAVLPRSAILQLEGPNEPNISGWTWPTSDPRDLRGGAAYIDALKAAVAADPWFAGVKVAGIVSWPEIGTRSDVINGHPYPRGGDVSLAHWIDEFIAVQTAADMKAPVNAPAGRPLCISETGWPVFERPDADGYYYHGPVSEEAQERRSVEALAYAASHGVETFCFYELLDPYEWDDPARRLTGFGLFRLDYSPRPVVAAIKAWWAEHQKVTPSPAPAPAPAPLPAPAVPGTVVIDIGVGEIPTQIDVRKKVAGKWRVSQKRISTKGR